MANTLTVQQLNDKFTAAILDSSNFIKESKNWAKDLFKKGARPGEKATLYFDGMGETAVVDDVTSSGSMDISAMNGDVKQYKVDLVVGNAKGKVSWNEVQERFEMGTIEADLIKPTANAMAEKLVRHVIDNSYLRSTGVVVANKGVSGDSANFASLASAVASLRKMRAGMTLVGHLDSDTMGILSSLPVTAGVNHFDAPSEKLQEMYGEAAIGTYHRCPMIDEPFMPSFTTAEGEPGSGCTVSAVVSGAGAYQIGITGIATAVSTIKAGSVFTIAGVNRCTAAGTPLVNSPYAFVVQEDVTGVSSAAVVKVLPLYFTGSGYIPTVGVEKINANAAVTWLTKANTTYAVGIIRAREALNWTPIEMLDIRGCENGSTTVPTMSFHTAFDGNINDATNTGRLDTQFVGKIVDPRLVRTVYWEL
jgi:hypothetical protein